MSNILYKHFLTNKKLTNTTNEVRWVVQAKLAETKELGVLQKQKILHVTKTKLHRVNQI